jgi:hypothetical protein
MKIENKGDAEKAEKALKAWRESESDRIAKQWTARLRREQEDADKLAVELVEFDCGPEWLADRIADDAKLGIGTKSTPDGQRRWQLGKLSSAIRLVRTTGATITPRQK